MGGFSSITADPLGTVLNADNVSFDGSTRGGVITTDGELLIGSTVAPHIRVGEITSPLGTLNIGYSSPNITLDLSGSGLAIDSFAPNSGTNPVVPTAGGLVNVVGTGSTTTVGSLNTLTVQLTGLTNHNVLLGHGTATVGLVAPSATSGIPLISQGAASDPVFGTVTVAGGGTGVTSWTPYAILTGGTSSTGPLQQVASIGTSGQVLTSGGAGTLPTWTTLPSGAAVLSMQTFTASGTYTPTAGATWVVIEAVGGGGGGGGAGSTTGSEVSCGGGGAGAAYGRALCSIAQIGVSQIVTIGNGGTAGSSAGGNGGDGGDTSVGTLLVVKGGGGALGRTGQNTAFMVGAAGGCTGTGTSSGATSYFFAFGNPGQWGLTNVSLANGWGGGGGGSMLGGGASGLGSPASGSTPSGYGGGGSGAVQGNSMAGQAGGAGAKGIVVITEYS